MNKKDFIDALKKELNYGEDKCLIINDILDNNFFISKKSKDNIIEELINKLEINDEEASKIYDVAVNIVKSEIKNKLKHPLKSKD